MTNLAAQTPAKSGFLPVVVSESKRKPLTRTSVARTKLAQLTRNKQYNQMDIVSVGLEYMGGTVAPSRRTGALTSPPDVPAAFPRARSRAPPGPMLQFSTLGSALFQTYICGERTAFS